MAFEKLGVGGVLTFDDSQAMRAMTRTQRIFAQLKKSAVRLRAGVTRLGQGMRNLAIAGAGVGIGIGIGVKQAADFEHQMSAVRAVTGASAKNMKALEKRAIEMGIKTQFSATQSAQAMELLGKASWNTTKILAKAHTVVALAAAEQMELSAATQIVTDTIGAMNLKGKQQGEVADVLALAAMKAQTGVAQLGEAMSYGAANAKDMGLTLYSTAATMALFAKAGIRGSRAGTAMNAVMRGLMGATRKSKDALASLGINMKKFYKDGKLNMPSAIKSIKQSLDKNFKTPLERNRKVLELFSIRGMTAFNVLAGQGGEALKRLTGTLKGSAKMTVKGMKEKGAAAIMAARRMDNLKGSVTLLKSSLEAFSIIVTKTFLGSMKKSVQDFTSRLNNLLKVMMALGADDSLKTQDALAKKFGKTTVQVALGIRDGLKMVSDSIGLVKDGIKKLASMMGKHIGEGSTRQIVRVIIAFTVLLAVIAPLVASLGAMKFLIGALFKVASGALTSLAALFWPLVIIAGILGLAFLALRKNGESFGQTFIRIFKEIYAFGMKLFYGVLLPMGKILLEGFVGFFNQIKPALMAVIGFVRTVISDIAGIIEAYTVDISSFWIRVAESISKILVQVGTLLGMVLKAVFPVLRLIWKLIVSIVVAVRPLFMKIINFALLLVKVVLNIGKSLMKWVRMVFTWIGAIVSMLRPIITIIVSSMVKYFSFLIRYLKSGIILIGKVISQVLDWTRKMYSYILPVLKVIGFMIKLLIEVGKVIYGIVIHYLSIAWKWVVGIAKAIWKWLKPAVDALSGAFKTVIGFMVKMGKAIRDVVMKPLRMMAGWLSSVLDKLIGIAGKIGISTATLKGMVKALREFAYGTRKVPAVYLRPSARIMAERSKMVLATTEKAKKETDIRKKEARKRKKDPCIDLKLSNKLKIDVPVKIGARQVAKATADHQDEIRERAGFTTKPWQKRQVKARAAVLTPFDD